MTYPSHNSPISGTVGRSRTADGAILFSLTKEGGNP
jgi:hypothetical protein